MVVIWSVCGEGEEEEKDRYMTWMKMTTMVITVIVLCASFDVLAD